ncbi:MAG: hypothetical protein V1760_03035 [Candidatus Peregrinibacteria bacterium]
MPAGRHHGSPDPRHAQKVKEGGKKADALRKKRERHHKELEVPIAEKELLKDLEQLHE